MLAYQLMRDMTQYGSDLGDLVNPLNIGSSDKVGAYSNDNHILALGSKYPSFKRPEKDMTKDFFKALEFNIPERAVELVNFHIYGGPGVGKTTVARAIGFHLKEFYGDDCQCIECQFLPDAVPHHIDPSKRGDSCICR